MPAKHGSDEKSGMYDIYSCCYFAVMCSSRVFSCVADVRVRVRARVRVYGNVLEQQSARRRTRFE